MTTNSSVRIIGPGRAGGALAIALARVGWTVVAPVHRGESLSAAANGVDLLVIATPDGAIAEVAREITPDPTTVVVHLSGALGLDGFRHKPLGDWQCVYALAGRGMEYRAWRDSSR